MANVITVKYVSDDINPNLRYDVMLPRSESIIPAVNAIKAIDGYINVAVVEYDDKLTLNDNLEYVFKIMQNGVITDSWTLSPPDGLTALVEPIIHNNQTYGHRSLSMGDVLEVDGVEYVCAMIGFTKVG